MENFVNMGHISFTTDSRAAKNFQGGAITKIIVAKNSATCSLITMQFPRFWH